MKDDIVDFPSEISLKKEQNFEKCFSLGKSLLAKIYINALIYKQNKYINNYIL